VRAGGGEHARAVVLLETGEESGSPDLPQYMEHLAERFGDISLVVCLDAGGGDYERLWLTSSLRGLVQLNLTARVLEKPQHSGIAGGVVPSSFQVMRVLLDRLEDPATGRVRIPEMHVEIPAARRTDAEQLVRLRPGAVSGAFPVVSGLRLTDPDEVELILNNTWRPVLSITGAAGLPDVAVAGNVLRTSTTLCLSFRLPPTADAPAALDAVRAVLTADVPYGAEVEISHTAAQSGWSAPEAEPWLDEALQGLGERIFGKEQRSMGIGGSVPFMELLGRTYPQAQFLITGALGSDSNMHVADEWLNIPFARKVTEAVAAVLDAHARS
jgi:acetylornithine deacetylase/succinyl-diaminopimelate desuccinylase-like protein